MKIQILSGVIAAYSDDGARECPGYNEILKLWNVRRQLVDEGIEHELIFGREKGRKILTGICVPDTEISMLSWIPKHPTEEEEG